MLRQVGVVLRKAIPETEVPSRCAGDEFALALPGAGLQVVGQKVSFALWEKVL